MRDHEASIEFNKINKQLEKLKFQVKMLSDSVDYDKHPIGGVIVSMDFDQDQFDTLHNIFEKYNNMIITEQCTYQYLSTFEYELKTALDIDEEKLSNVIFSFHQNYQWTSICDAWIEYNDLSWRIK